MAETFAQHYLEKAQRYGDSKVAVRQKKHGIWQEYSWAQSLEQVKLFGMGMLQLGLLRGEQVAAIGDNDKEYLWGYLGVHAIGGAMVGMYTDANPQEAAYIIDHSDAKYVLAQDQEQVDKMLDIRADIPQVRKVIYWNDSGLWGYENDWLLSYQDVIEMGRALLAKEPDRFETEVKLGSADDLALICYTSGTTGLPKGAMLSHKNMLVAARMFEEVDPRYEDDNHVSFLPMGWIAEHILGIANHCYYGIIINFPEEPETVRQNLREIAPEVVVYGSRLWDNLVSMIQVRLLDSSWLNKAMYKACMPIGNRMAEKRMRGAAAGPGLAISYKIADMLFFGPLRDQLGMSNIRTAITGGAALSPDVMRFFHAIGINLKQVYGMTEVATAGTSHYTGDIKFASVGKPVPGADVRIGENDEIQLSSPTLFMGYYKDPEKTAEDVQVDPDGRRWFLTGDAGYIDEDGHLIYLDRVKDMIELSNGARFSPQFIEGRLKFNPNVREVMTVGDPTRDFVTALIIFDFDNVARWAEKKGIGFTTFADLSQKPPVLELVKGAVEEINSSLPPDGRIKAFVLMPKEFDADEAEMTRSRKLKRQVLVEKYSEIIDALYGKSADPITVRQEVTYQDGSTGFTENTLTVVRV